MKLIEAIIKATENLFRAYINYKINRNGHKTKNNNFCLN